MANYQIDWAKRLSTAWRIAEDGGTLGDVAKAWGCSKPNVCMRLATHDRHLQSVLRGNATFGPVLSRDHAVLRLRNVAEHGIRGAARAEGTNPSAIHAWMRRNAPDGALDALEDFLYDDEDLSFMNDNELDDMRAAS